MGSAESLFILNLFHMGVGVFRSQLDLPQVYLVNQKDWEWEREKIGGGKSEIHLEFVSTFQIGLLKMTKQTWGQSNPNQTLLHCAETTQDMMTKPL